MSTSSGAKKAITFGSIAETVRSTLKRTLRPLAIIAAIECALLYFGGSPATFSFALIAFSSLAALGIWAKFGRGLPMFALIAAQNLIIYGLPIAASNEIVLQYPREYLIKAGWDVFAFNMALIAAWRMGMAFIHPSSALCYALLGLDKPSPKLTRLGLTLVMIGTAYQILSSVNGLEIVLGSLPAGSNSIIYALLSAVSACGFFLSGVMVGRGEVARTQRMLFWAMLSLQCIISAAGFLLSAAILVVFASITGLFWGGGRLPWRFIVIVGLIFAFLNIGKFAMREKYWANDESDQGKETMLMDIPAVYSEWTATSIDILAGNAVVQRSHNAFAQFDTDETKMKGQSLLQRVNNLANLLFAIDAMDSGHIQPLGGATYALIPPLLVPRILWPDKPRTHQGQVMLNVHFGRQDLNSTFHTYIAWGLLPEAYGNFGPITGAVILGVFLGLIFAWIEQFVAKKLVLSLEGFLAFSLFLGMANSYEMVASVLVTSLFQAFVPIIVASAPFVARIAPKPVAAPPSPVASES